MKLKNFAKVGEGANGVVFRCKDELDRDLAVKFFTSSLDPIVDQVLGHAASLKKIDHPNVVKIIGVERLARPESREGAPDELALVMEYVPGQSFGDWLASNTNKDQSIFEDFADGLLAGLDAFHSAGMAHGDLHTQNIRVSGGMVKLIDPMAKNPGFVFTTSSVVDSLRRDISNARHLLYEAMRSFRYSTPSLERLFDPSLRIQNINDLRTRLADAVAINRNESGGTENMSQDATFYKKCRDAQSQKNQVEWQELGKEASRRLPAAFETLRTELSTSINSKSEAQKSLTQAMIRIEDVLAFVCAGVESSDDDGIDAVSLLAKVLTIDWAKSGDVPYVHIPEGVFYGAFYIAGAVATASRKPQVVERLTTMRHLNRYNQQVKPVLKSRDVIGWPKTIQDCGIAWNWLNNLYSEVSVLRKVFPTENDYQTALHAFNLLCCVAEVRLDSIDEYVARLKTSGHGDRYAVPPLWVRATNARLLSVWQLVSHRKFKSDWDNEGKQPLILIKSVWPQLVEAWMDINSQYQATYHVSGIEWVYREYPLSD